MKAVIFPLVFALCAEIPKTFAEVSYRLPNGKISIESYTVKIIPNLKDDFSFKGDSTVILKIMEDMKCVTMNIKNLKVEHLYHYIYDRKLHRETDASYNVNNEKEMLESCFSKTLPRNTRLEFQIIYTGKIRDDFKGLYKVQYEENGVKKWLAATQLEPTYARMVFPCFDEPQYHAKFSLAIARHTNQISSSITKLKSTSEKDSQIDNRVWDIYEESAPCATYMVDFVVHQFPSRSIRAGPDGQLKVYSKKHTEKESDYITSNYANWYKTFLGYLNINGYTDLYIDITALCDHDEYSPKRTMMIYSEKDVLHSEEFDVEKHKEEITKAAIHKIYLKLIGFHVKLHSWDDAWLRESFGVYFQYVISNQIYPFWKMEDRFVTEVLQDTLFKEEMYPDSVMSSVTNAPSEIQIQKYNFFINKKGASIINMLQQLIGDYLHEGFKNAINKAHNADTEFTPDVLWDEISLQIKNKNLFPEDIPLKTFMHNWLTSSGYPLVTVETSGNGEVVIKQETYDSSTTTTKIPDFSWIVPVMCEKKSTGSEKKYTTWLRDSKLVTENYQLNKDEWILCNSNHGYYRVTYSKENWNLLIEQLKSQPDIINNIVRAQLIDDSFHSAIHKKIPFAIPFNLGTYLEKESDMLPWFSFVRYVNHNVRFYEDTGAITYLKRYFSDIIQHQYNRIGFEAREGDSYITKMGRAEIIFIACQLKLSDCLTNSARMYNTHINDLAKVPSDLKYVVYCSSFKISNEKQATWDKLWSVYKNTQRMSEKELVLSSLACANDEILLKKYLKMTIDPEESTLFQFEKNCIIKSSAKFYKGVTAVLEVIYEMLPKLGSLAEKTKQTLRLMAKEIHFNIDSAEHVEKAKQIVTQLENDKDKNTELLENLKKSIDLGARKVDYKNQNSDEIKQTIKDVMGYDPPTTTTTTSTTSTTTSTIHAPTQRTTEGTTTTGSPEVPSRDSRVTPLTTMCLIIIIGLITFVI